MSRKIFMTLKKYGTYIHESAKDLFIQIMKIQYVSTNHLKVRVTWWNIGFTGEPWLVWEQAIDINPRKWHTEWKEFDHEVDYKSFRGE